MRSATALFAAWLAAPLVVAACGGSDKMDAEPFATLQDCYDEHHKVESLPVQQAIVVCCLDHPIAGVHPSCQDTQVECESHVRDHLDASVTFAEITAACMTYIGQK